MRPDAPNDRGVDEHALTIELDLQTLENRLPVPTPRPQGEPVVDGFPGSKPWRKVSPRPSGLQTVEDLTDEQAIAQFRGRVTSTWKYDGQQLPLRVHQSMAVRHSQL